MSQAVGEPAGHRVHLTGQVGWTEGFQVIGPRDTGRQTHAVIDMIETVLGAMGGTLDNVVSTTLYHRRDDDLAAIPAARCARFSCYAGPATRGITVAGRVDPALLVELAVSAVIPPERFVSSPD